MENNSIFRYAGWSAYLSGFAFILMLITSAIFAMTGPPVDTISSIAEILWTLLILPIVFAFHYRLLSNVPSASLIALIIGFIGISYSIAVTFLLNFGPRGFGDTGIFINATIGLWFLITSSLLLSGKLQPFGLSVLGILIGISYIFSIIGLWFKASWMLAFLIHIMILSVLYPIWAFWAGHVLLRSNSQ
ncbi:MAG TPA: hypothetical protein VFI68_10580 [Anaerolineales bacterium]|nr:hypothetical protein [Anaerolineales bacterium]